MLTNTMAYRMAGMGVFAWPQFIGNDNNISGMIVAIIISLICTVAAFILTCLAYSDEPAKAKKVIPPARAGHSLADRAGSVIK